jgi:hypothetical protein
LSRRVGTDPKRLLGGIVRAVEEEVGTEVDDPSPGDRAARSLA